MREAYTARRPRARGSNGGFGGQHVDSNAARNRRADYGQAL